MAEQQDDRQTEDLSDEASPYRLEEMRRKGQVAQSRELSGLLGLLAAGACLYAMAPIMGQTLFAYMDEVFRFDSAYKTSFESEASVGAFLMKCFKVMSLVSLPVAIIGFIVSGLGSFVQVGAVFSTEPLNWDFSKIDPLSGFKRLFSLKHAYESLRMILRGIVIAGVSYGLLKTVLFDSTKFGLSAVDGMILGYDSAGRTVFFTLCMVLVVFAGFDFWLQKWEYGKSVRLTKKEAKEEQKEHEGDPMIKARIRAIQRDTARKRMMEAVKTADVVVTNPTHIAVALKYDRDKMKAPKVVAKGADFLAQRIKQIAGDAGIPLVENVPLARTLFKSVKIGQLVPRQLYQAVAEVLAYVYKLRGRV
jgi:flagellar biosynthesis protein FlhB